jgi:hypothetical protein
LIPRSLILAPRLLDTFFRLHGQNRRSGPFPVDGKGEFQPWLTYPMLEFLETLDFNGKSVFEFGAGGSTLYWARRGATVTSVELDLNWYKQILRVLPSNAAVTHEADGHAYAAACLGGCYDVIVIDGAERFRCAESAIQALAPGGMVILDNAEWYPNAADFLRGADLIEIPFSGFGPINAFTSTSTAFLRRDFRFPRSKRKAPVGGKTIRTLDDKH